MTICTYNSSESSELLASIHVVGPLQGHSQKMNPNTLSRLWVHPNALSIDAIVLPSRARPEEYKPEDSALLNLQPDLWRPLNADLPHPIYRYILPKAAQMVVPTCIALETLTHMNTEELSKFSASISSYIDMLKHLNAFILATHGYITLLVDKCKPLLVSILPPSLSDLLSKSSINSDLSTVSASDIAHKFTLWYREVMSFLLNLSIWIKELANVQSILSPVIRSVASYSCLRDICRKQETVHRIIKFIRDTESVEVWIEQMEASRLLEKRSENNAVLNWHEQQRLIRRCLQEMDPVISVSFVDGSDRVEHIAISADASTLFCSSQWSEALDARFKQLIRELMENKKLLSDYKVVLYNLSFLDDLSRPKARVVSSAIPNLSADGQTVLEKIWVVCSFAYMVETSLRNRDHFNSHFYGVLEGIYSFNLNNILANWVKEDEMLSLYFKFKMRVAQIRDYVIILDQIVYILDSLASIRDDYLQLDYGMPNGAAHPTTTSLPSSSTKKNIGKIKQYLARMHELVLKYLDLTGLKYTDILKQEQMRFYVLCLLQMPKSCALALSDDDISNHILTNISAIS